jgi:hypothetical protein
MMPLEVRDPTPDEREVLKAWTTVRTFAETMTFKPEGAIDIEHVHWLFGEWVEKGILEVWDPRISGVKFRLKEGIEC